MRRALLPICFLFLFGLFLGMVPAAGQANTGPYTLTRSDIAHLKIFGNAYDRIHFFIQDKSEHTFRISGLTQAQAEDLLARLKAGESITLQTTSNRLAYLDVTSWQ